MIADPIADPMHDRMHDPAARIRFYLHKDFRAAGIRFYLHKEYGGAMLMKMAVLQ